MTIASRKEAVKAAILLACVNDWTYDVTLDEVVDAILAALDAIEPVEPTDATDANYTIDFGAITPVIAESICLPVEPTDAEVEAAKQTYWNHRRAMSNTGLDSWVGDESSWRAALIAARRWYE
jgi:hypothetical protein